MKWKKWDLSSRGFPMNRSFAVAIASVHRAADSYLKLIGFLQARYRKASPAEGVHSAGYKVDLFFDLLQFRTIEVTALEKRQRDFEDASLASLEFKLLAALRCRADR